MRHWRATKRMLQVLSGVSSWGISMGYFEGNRSREQFANFKDGKPADWHRCLCGYGTQRCWVQGNGNLTAWRCSRKVRGQTPWATPSVATCKHGWWAKGGLCANVHCIIEHPFAFQCALHSMESIPGWHWMASQARAHTQERHPQI